MSKPPQTLDELGESLSLWETLNTDQGSIEAKFHPLADQFLILEKYEVPIPDDIRIMHNNLPNVWTNFQQILIDSDAMLKKYKVTMTFH